MTATAAPKLLALTALRVEAAAVRRGAPSARVLVSGMGPARARRTAGVAAGMPAEAVAVAGFCGALSPDLRPGDLVVATAVLGPGAPVELPGAPVIAGALRRRGLRAHVAPLRSVPRPAIGRARAAGRAGGAVAVDMESWWLAPAAGDRPLAVVRAVVDAPVRELADVAATVRGGLRAARALREAGVVLGEWAAASRPRVVRLAAPRAFCAGVERAVEAVESLLETHEERVHVRGEIVHNRHVVDDLRLRGARFVGEVDEVPEGGTVVLSAHGVAPEVRRRARERRLRVVDATCPLVAKVHGEVRRFAASGYTVLLVGHAGHDEVAGTMGEAPGSVVLVQDRGEAERVEVGDPERVAWVTQTTLAVDETDAVVEVLRRRFPAIVGPPAHDICYATQNRQQAVIALAGACDGLLVVGSSNSSNSRRLVEVAERHGCPARLVDDERELDLRWLGSAATVGVTAGASAPEALVQRVIAALGALGPVEVHEHPGATESRTFRPPPGLRAKG